jgi:septum formation protein
MPSTPPRLVLASTSTYRRELLLRLGIPFETCSPETDETRLPGETPDDTALRLSEAKARAVADRFPDALIIGSDQVAYCGERIYGKPHTHENAVRQLREMSGQTVVFQTGLCLFNARTGVARVRAVPTRITFRQLDDSTIERYLHREQPYNCAGSAKSEGLGIALIARFEGEDPNALVGLPLIALCDLLGDEGVSAI